MKTWSEVDRVEDDGCHETPVDTGERQEETEINGGGRGRCKVLRLAVVKNSVKTDTKQAPICWPERRGRSEEMVGRMRDQRRRRTDQEQEVSLVRKRRRGRKRLNFEPSHMRGTLRRTTDFKYSH